MGKFVAALITTHPCARQSITFFSKLTMTIVYRCHSVYICRFYTVDSSIFTPGLPGSGVVGRPSTISPCELEQLSHECVVRINSYRTGKIGFSNGMVNPNLPVSLEPLLEQTHGHQCSNRQVRHAKILSLNTGKANRSASSLPFFYNGTLPLTSPSLSLS